MPLKVFYSLLSSSQWCMARVSHGAPGGLSGKKLADMTAGWGGGEGGPTIN